MKKKYSASLIILVLFAALAGCNDATDNRTDTLSEHSVLLSEDDNGITVVVGVGNTIVIELQSNPSTGYHWEQSNTGDTFLSQEGESNFIENRKCSGLVGCGGIEQLSFVASRSGTGTISLVHHRSFEDEPIDQFSVKIIVTD